ncbi:hypothetical protein EVAR_46842_1 [Eumeta japonica]|uniref:Uncharacterized protein n=1 Tax=Eumeta variegata TaxID=151549 RepID=A0A4C1XNJ0_EUMVA|nr:hypothetical protein EVAR_46842_1 [Eumeta japonica]
MDARLADARRPSWVPLQFMCLYSASAAATSVRPAIELRRLIGRDDAPAALHDEARRYPPRKSRQPALNVHGERLNRYMCHSPKVLDYDVGRLLKLDALSVIRSSSTSNFQLPSDKL